MRLMILSDGTSNTTSLVDMATNERVEDVTRIEWECEAGGGDPRARAKVYLTNVPITALVDGAEVDPAVFFVNEDTKRFKK